MINAQGLTQTLFDSRDVALVGGKAVNLGRLIRAGFPVPGGFVVNTRAYAFAKAQSGDGVVAELPDDVKNEIRVAYRAMGGGTVAVRSSATAEDMGSASMAGQYETYLDIVGEEDLLEAVRKCWASLDSPRIRVYLQEHKIDPAQVAMAVVVQRLVSADVAGVLFTASPHDGGSREMIIEASWGLGESVVSGRVQPDVLRLDRDTGRVIAATIADKRVHLAAGVHEEQPVEESRRKEPCLRGRDVHHLWQLGMRAAKYFGSPQDIEWAIHEGEVFLLQSRPITTRQDAEAYEEVLRGTRQHLREELAAGRGPWALHNLAETLPHPTPLTWSVIGRFMSASGGFGTMYRQAGFEPSAALNHDGFLERIAGRVYMDAARAPEMFFEKFPFAYDLQELKRSPDASQTPPTLPRGTMSERASAGRRLAAVNAKVRTLSDTVDRHLRDEVFPHISEYVAAAKKTDLTRLSVAELVALWQEHEKKVLDNFAPQSLMPSLISGMALDELRTFLAETMWEEDAEALAQYISSGGLANRTLTADAELYEVGKQSRPLEKWLIEHGHRAAGEFDLAAPRWRERPAAVRDMAARMASGDGPMERHRKNGEDVHRKLQDLLAKLAPADRSELDRRVGLLRRYVSFREDGKDFLMLGYDLLRDVALEAGRRLDIGDDVFYLTREDMFDSLRVGFAPHHLIEQRKLMYRAEERVALPRVIGADEIDGLGDLAELKNSATGHKAFAVSPGQATGKVRVLRSPTDAGEMGTGYILVCPSTDPSWTPLFVNAAALILECGGTLSHGAVVAREMGLPAVVLADATRLFAEGEELDVDGSRGWVGRAADRTAEGAANGTASGAGASVDALAEAPDPNDGTIPQTMIPPPPGRKDRTAAKWRNIAAVAWTLFLLAFFFLPKAWVYAPTLAVMDRLLWPIASSWGKPAVVVVVAGGIALLTLLIQKFMTDNRRLLEAKRRANALKKQADALPAGSVRKTALLAHAAPVQFRTLMAAMVPVGILLGPMLMPFVWFKDRIDPSVVVAPAGSPVQVVAMVDGAWSDTVQITYPPPMTLDDTTPALRSAPPIKPMLERLLSLYRQPRKDPAEPWELQAAPDLGRQQTADDLQAYLDEGVPPQGITWQMRLPENAAGRFPVSVAAKGQPPVGIVVVLGEQYPPGETSVAGAGAIRELRVVYPQPKQAQVFWRPLAGMSGKLGAWDIGWLWLYILVYLPILLIMRAVLRVA